MSPDSPSHALAQTLAIGFCGGMASGKSTLARQLSIELDADLISFGDYVRYKAQEGGIACEREHLQNLGQHLYNQDGAQGLVEQTLLWAQPKTERHIFDGVRHIDVWRYIRSFYTRSCLVGLQVEPSDQLKRLRMRGLHTDPSIERWRSHPVEQAQTELQRMADLLLDSQLPPQVLSSAVQTYIGCKMQD